jgi:hypothetical protein
MSVKTLLVLVASILLVDAFPTSYIRFFVYNQTGQAAFNYTSPNSSQKLLATCPKGAKVFLLVPGINSPIVVFWAAPLIKNNLKYFGGCVIFAEHYYYEVNYFNLAKNETFILISSIIAEQMMILNNNGRNISDSGKSCSLNFPHLKITQLLDLPNSIYWAQLWGETNCEHWTDSARKEYPCAKD